MFPIVKLLPDKSWNQLLSGAQKGSTRAIDRLFQDVSPVIRNMALKFNGSSLGADEFYSEGCRAFMEIVSNDKLSVKNAKHYILKSVKRCMQNMLQSENRFQRPLVSLNNLVRVNNPDGNTIFSTTSKYFIDKKASNPASVCFLHEVLKEINILDAKKRQIFIERVIGTPSKEVAEKFGLTVANVDQIKERIKNGLIKWCNT